MATTETYTITFTCDIGNCGCATMIERDYGRHYNDVQQTAHEEAIAQGWRDVAVLAVNHNVAEVYTLCPSHAREWGIMLGSERLMGEKEIEDHIDPF